ncbi:MAG: hypothetical protein OEY66_00725 [Gammaproteobacteria bacterium]|nr:hypothetical protein [Gammaproteobacteria bacterium]
MIKKILHLLVVSALCFFAVNSAPSYASLKIGGQEVNFEQVAVMVYAKTPDAKAMKRTAQTRIESILLDNGITVLDQDKADDLKNIWKRLEDPSYFVTAEDFVENAEKYEIDGLIRLYLNADATSALANFYTATAQADIRFVDKDANVEAYTTVSMGVPGVPPSDGLTRNAALLNAIQRAVDEAASKTGLEIIDYAKPRTLTYELQGPTDVMHKVVAVKKEIHDFSQYASLANKTWTNEEVSTTCKAPSGELGAVAGYVRETSAGMRRSYSSLVHLVDIGDKKETGIFDSTTKKKKGKTGSVKVLDCMFLTSWRYLAAVTGLELFLWDTERGLLMSSIRLDNGTEQANLGYTKYNNKDYLSVDTGQGVVSYEIVRKK